MRRGIGRVAAVALTAAGLAALPAGSAAARKHHRVYVPAHCTDEAYKPAEVIVACGDGNLTVDGLSWRHWNRGRARATGTAHANDCKPACFDGTIHDYRVQVRLSRPHRCSSGPAKGKHQYTRLKLRFPGKRPDGYRRTEKQKLPCPSFVG